MYSKQELMQMVTLVVHYIGQIHCAPRVSCRDNTIVFFCGEAKKNHVTNARVKSGHFGRQHKGWDGEWLVDSEHVCYFGAV